MMIKACANTISRVMFVENTGATMLELTFARVVSKTGSRRGDDTLYFVTHLNFSAAGSLTAEG